MMLSPRAFRLRRVRRPKHRAFPLLVRERSPLGVVFTLDRFELLPGAELPEWSLACARLFDTFPPALFRFDETLEQGQRRGDCLIVQPKKAPE